MRSQALIAILLSTACIEVEPKHDSGECEAPMAPYDAAFTDLSREPQTLGVDALLSLKTQKERDGPGDAPGAVT